MPQNLQPVVFVGGPFPGEHDVPTEVKIVVIEWPASRPTVRAVYERRGVRFEWAPDSKPNPDIGG